MKTVVRAAIAALSFASIGPAVAGEGEGAMGNTRFAELPGVIAQASVQSAPRVTTTQNGQAVHAYITNSRHGTWLFAPNETGGGDN
jgi:hypothetical protein